MKTVKIYFHVVPPILGKSYRFEQPIIHFKKADTLILLKIRIMFCPPGEPKKVSDHGLLSINLKFLFPEILCPLRLNTLFQIFFRKISWHQESAHEHILEKRLYYLMHWNVTLEVFVPIFISRQNTLQESRDLRGKDR